MTHERIVATRNAADAVELEVYRATQKHPEGMKDSHHAYAIILEEVEEFWDEVRKQTDERDRVKMRTELVQIAAMAVRTIVDLGL